MIPGSLGLETLWIHLWPHGHVKKTAFDSSCRWVGLGNARFTSKISRAKTPGQTFPLDGLGKALGLECHTTRVIFERETYTLVFMKVFFAMDVCLGVVK